jgi:tryptophan-rich sensory protein
MTAIALRRWAPVVTAAVVALAVGAAGGLATDLSPWYFALKMPSWKPPDWLFGPAWTLIYALSALSAVSAWWNARNRPDRFRILLLFGVNAVLGIAWSVLFFTLHHPDWALIEVTFLWASIAALIAGLLPISRPAAWLLTPYLAWVSFAAVLNLAVVQLNAKSL